MLVEIVRPVIPCWLRGEMAKDCQAMAEMARDARDSLEEGTELWLYYDWKRRAWLEAVDFWNLE